MEKIKGVKRIAKIVLIIGLLMALLGAVVWYVKTEDGIWRDDERGNPSTHTGSASLSPTEGIIVDRGRIVEQALLDLLYEYGDIQQLTEQDIIRILDMSNKLGRNITSLASCTDAEILWCTSQEYPDHLERPEDLEKLLNAELVTQYPRIDDLPEDKLNGVIQFERHETDPDTGVSSTWMLEFIKEEDFEELFIAYQESGNRDVLKYFTLDDEGNVVIATWSREEGDYSSNNTALQQTNRKKIRAGMTEDKIKQEVDNRYEVTNYTSDDISAEYITYTVRKQPIYYKNLVQQYTMPFEYLWSLLVMGESDDFVLKLADNVHNTKITIGIFDNIDKAVTTNIERYTEEFKDRTETYEKDEGESEYSIVSEDPRHGSIAHESIENSPDGEWDIEIYDYVHTEIVTTYQDITQIQVIYADTWIVEVTVQFVVDIDTEEIYNNTENLGDEPWDDSDCYTDTDSETRQHPDTVDPQTGEVIEEGEEYTVSIKTEYYKYKHTIDKSKQSKLDLTTSKYQILPADIREKTYIVDDDEMNFIELLRGDSIAFTYLTNPTGIEWLAYVLSSNHYTTTFVDLTRYLLNKAKFPDDPSLSFDFSIFEPTELSSITSITGGTIQEKVWFALKNLGYCDISVAAAMGNIDYESGGFNPSAVEGGAGAGIGLIQWTGGRRTALENYAASKGVPWQDEDTQIEFLVTEISGQGRAVGYATQRRSGAIVEEGIVSTHDNWADANNSLDDATLHFMRFFESPRSRSSLGERQERARRYYDEFSGRTGPLTGGSESIVASAVEVHRYIRENGYRYAQAGVTVPNYSTRTIDCSSYVTWVLVNAGVSGFSEGMYQATSSVFGSNPWGFAEVSVNEALPGDIVVYSGHVEIVAYNDPSSSKFKVYNCGGSSSITATGTPDLPEASTSGHTKSSVIKILRVN